MGKSANSSSLSDHITDVLVWLIFTTFEIYYFIAAIILRIFFPITKYMVKRKLRIFGIEINGSSPTDIVVSSENETRFYTRVAVEGSFGLLEGMMDKDSSTKDFKGFLSKILNTRRIQEMNHPLAWVAGVFNLQTKAKAWEVAQQHYDAGNDIIEAMLDKNRQYTCGYWKDSANLEDAQIAKMDLVAKKLQLKKGMKVLDLGCGYGTLAYHFAKNYGVSVVGVTVSEEQVKYAQKLSTGLPCEFRLCDYRDVNEKFDRISAVGIFEHVGRKNYKEFFEVCTRCLKPDGLLLVHCIGKLHKEMVSRDMWVHKYIFRNGSVPHYIELCKAIEGSWIIEDWHNFGQDYTKTLAAWETNFDRIWPKFEKKYGERFHTMWKMYLQMSQALFTTRSLHLWQVVLSKDGIRGDYYAAR